MNVVCRTHTVNAVGIKLPFTYDDHTERISRLTPSLLAANEYSIIYVVNRGDVPLSHADTTLNQGYH